MKQIQPEETLDPADWEPLRRTAHAVVDDAVTYLAEIRDRPVWSDMPQTVRQGFCQPVPQTGAPLETVYDELKSSLLPYPMGNIHPRFWMWYMGASNFTGALGDFLAAIVGSNLGGGNHAAALIDRQVTDWLRQMVGFPAGASGTLTSGGSVANLIGLTVVDTGGAELGRVKAVLNHGATDLLEIALPGSSRTALLPFTQAAVPTVDLAAGRIVADPPLGVLPETEGD